MCIKQGDQIRAKERQQKRKGAAYDSGVLAVLVTYGCTGHNRDVALMVGKSFKERDWGYEFKGRNLEVRITIQLLVSSRQQYEQECRTNKARWNNSERQNMPGQ